MRKATDFHLTSKERANISALTEAFVANPGNAVEQGQSLIQQLNNVVFGKVLDQLTRDGRGNEDATRVMSQLGVVTSDEDHALPYAHYHYITIQENREKMSDAEIYELREQQSLMAHMFLHQRDFNCGDFRPDQDPNYFGSFMVGTLRFNHTVIQLRGCAVDRLRYCTNV